MDDEYSQLHFSCGLTELGEVMARVLESPNDISPIDIFYLELYEFNRKLLNEKLFKFVHYGWRE